MSLRRTGQGPLYVGIPPGFGRVELGGCKPGAQVVRLRLQCPPIGRFALEQYLQRAQGTNDEFAIFGKRPKIPTVSRRQVPEASNRSCRPARRLA